MYKNKNLGKSDLRLMQEFKQVIIRNLLHNSPKRSCSKFLKIQDQIFLIENYLFSENRSVSH